MKIPKDDYGVVLWVPLRLQIHVIPVVETMLPKKMEPQEDKHPEIYLEARGKAV